MGSMYARCPAPGNTCGAVAKGHRATCHKKLINSSHVLGFMYARPATRTLLNDHGMRDAVFRIRIDFMRIRIQLFR
jgi:hypothetical protein